MEQQNMEGGSTSILGWLLIVAGSAGIAWLSTTHYKNKKRDKEAARYREEQERVDLERRSNLYKQWDQHRSK